MSEDTTDQVPPKAPNVKEKAAGQNRHTQTRNFELRDSDIRETLRMAYSDALHIPPEKIPAGFEYHFGRDTYRNEPDPTRIPALMQRYWTLVPADRHPEMVYHRLDDRTRHLDGYIQIKGLVLMERPARVGEIEREMEAEASLASMINPAMGTMNNPDFNKVGVHAKAFTNQTAIQKMRSFKE